MNKNFFRILFIIVIIILVFFAIYQKYKTDNKQIEIVETEQTKQVKMLRELKLGIAEFDTINPIISKNKNVQSISKLIFNSLLDIDKNFKITNSLLDEYSKVEEKVYLFKLKDNIKWHSGNELTTDDVIFTIEALQSVEIDSIYKENVKNIEKVEKIDKYRFKIFLIEQEDFFEYNLIFPIISLQYYKIVEEINETAEKINIPGTGIFKLNLVNNEKILLEKNNNFWNENYKTNIEKIYVTVYKDIGEIYNSFKLGNVDLINTSNLNYNQYVGNIGYNKVEYIGRNHDFLSLNCNNEILSMKEIRQALSKMINKNYIVNNVLKNNYMVYDFPLDYGNWLYNTSEEKEEIEKTADAILIEKGWKLNDVWEKNINGKLLKLEFNLVVNELNETRILVANTIKEELIKNGVIINIIKVPEIEYTNYIMNKTADILFTGVSINFTPNLEYYFGEANIANYKNDEINTMLKEIKTIKDETKLKEKYSKIIEIYNSDNPYITLYADKNVFLYNSRLVGAIEPNWYNIFNNIETWVKEI